MRQKLNAEAPLSHVHKGIKRKYNPPIAPHQGGVWERMVRSCKRMSYAILGSRTLTDEILNTTMCLVEVSLNARLLTPVSDDPDSLEALTPNHFLLGQHSLAFPSLRSSTHNVAKLRQRQHRPLRKPKDRSRKLHSAAR